MKLTAIVSLVLALLGVLVPLAVSADNPMPGSQPSENGYDKGGRPSPYADEDKNGYQENPEAQPDGNSGDISVKVLLDGNTAEIKLEDYLTGVTAAEMPASFEPEALKAQAVAARTYTLYKMQVAPSPNHPEADVCGDPNCCKAYCSELELREKWGADFDANYRKIQLAVNETKGEYMTYENEPILAVFHAASADMTETSGAVWGRDMPYLLSVESPETDAEVTNYVTEVRVSEDDFRETILSEYPSADLSGDASGWIEGITYTQSGRTAYAVIGGIGVKGTEIRSLFGLRSTNMEISAGDGEIVFTVTGSGHGVGMSQYGANTLAKQGYDYHGILNWYYVGVSFAQLEF